MHLFKNVSISLFRIIKQNAHKHMENITQFLFPIQLVLFGLFLINVVKYIYITIKNKVS